jgi:hypothetical protein
VAKSLADFSTLGARGINVSLVCFFAKRFFIWSKNFIVTPLVATLNVPGEHANDIQSQVFLGRSR